jgi:Putative F0F1-ATPase subunit Ca2+/Mg2+ transporter
MGFQMGAIMFLGTFGGYKLDKYLGNAIPVCTVVLALLSIAIALYLTLKDFLRINKNK